MVLPVVFIGLGLGLVDTIGKLTEELILEALLTHGLRTLRTGWISDRKIYMLGLVYTAWAAPGGGSRRLIARVNRGSQLKSHFVVML